MSLTLLAWLRFEIPAFLALLAVIPIVVAMSVRSLAGLGPVRRVLALIARTLVILCAVFALAGAQRVDTTDAMTVIFLFDRSASVPRKWQKQAFKLIREAAGHINVARGDRLGVVAFDGRSAIEQLPRPELQIERVSEPLVPDQTDLAAALRMGMALFTRDTIRRVVLLSDGNQNVGEAREEADRYAAAGIPIDVWPERYDHQREVVFERLTAPPTASVDETINLRVVLRARRPTRGVLRLYQNDALVDLDPTSDEAGVVVELDAGANALTIPVPLRVAGAHRFRATFEPLNPEDDAIAANNEARAFTVVSGQGRILILTRGGGPETQDDYQGAVLLARALEREKLVCDVELVGTQAIDQVHLLEYSLVILNNVPAGELSEEEHRALAVYVRELGGGLIMLGGDDSFGAGGWLDTPVEQIMPVRFDVKAKRQIPKGALVLIMHASEVPQGNYIGERAAIAAIKTLSSRDLVGVLSYQWQGNNHWVVPLQPVGNKQRLIGLIKKMQMGDMPSLDEMMRPAAKALASRKDVEAKHIIVISDFDPQPPRSDVLRMMKREGITCSTIAIGYGGHPIDEMTARRIAKVTGGKFYRTRNFRRIPQIFIKESRVVRRSLISELPFTPQIADPLSTLIAGLRQGEIPALGGYVLTTAKPLATVALVRPTQDAIDPILAHWQVGLGKAVAFTSGMWLRWGEKWAAWPGFSKLWAQIARWASRQQPAAAFDVSTSVQGGRAHVRIDALDKNAEVINFMSIEGVVVDPQNKAHRLTLTQTGPGRYEAEFDAGAVGSYIMNLAYRMGRGPDAQRGTLQAGVSVSFSPEYRELSANEALLKELARRSGGQLLDDSPQAAAKLFDPQGLPKAEIRRTIWEDLVRLMLILFLIDVAIRRIAIDPIRVARRLRQRIAEMAGAPRPEAAAATLGSLKGAREKLREELKAPVPDASTRFEAREEQIRSTQELAEALDGASELDTPVVARPTRKAPPSSEADFTSRLLKAKKRARERLEEESKDER